jgi:hypothetical protein
VAQREPGAQRELGGLALLGQRPARCSRRWVKSARWRVRTSPQSGGDACASRRAGTGGRIRVPGTRRGL